MEKICVIGSGWAASAFLKYIDDSKYNITVISPNKNFLYTPLLPHTINGNINLHIHITEINKNIEYMNDRVYDIEDNTIITSEKPYSFDYIIFCHGSEVNTFNIKGVQEYCKFVKTSDDIYNINEYLLKFKNERTPINICVIGCGPTGVDIIGNLIDKKSNIQIYAIDGMKKPLMMFNDILQEYTMNIWKENNVDINLGNFVKEVTEDEIVFDNKKIKYDLAIWCGGIKDNTLTNIVRKKFEHTNRNGILVNEYLKVVNSKNMYAIGDCAYTGNPPTAQVAYQQGKYLAYNFNNKFSNKEPFKYNHNGQFCYVGNDKSIYQYNKDIYFKGKIANYIHNFSHIFNTIGWKHSFELFKGIFE